MESIIVKKNNIEHLAFSTGLKNKALKGINTSILSQEPGLIVFEDQIETWKITGFYEINNEIYFYGPLIEGELLSDISIDIGILKDLVNAITLVNTTKYKTNQFSLSSVFRTKEKKMLFLPPLLIDFLNSRRTEDENLLDIYPWNDPDLEGEAARAFTAATIAYRTTCGTTAYSGQNKDDLLKAIRSRDFTSPLLIKPDLRSEIYDLLVKSLEGKGTLTQWQKVLNLYTDEDWYDKSMPEDQAAAILKAAKKKERKRLLKSKFQTLINKNKSRLIIAVAAIAVISSMLIPPITKALAPPPTQGMNQIEVIRLYYNSIDSLEFEIAEDCITSDAGKSDINQIVTLSAIIKARNAYENTSEQISVKDWKSAGQQAIETNVLIWGIDNIKIELISPDTFAITYEKWTPAERKDSIDSAPQPLRPEGVLIRDTAHLSMKKEWWVIDKLEREIINEIEYRENTN